MAFAERPQYQPSMRSLKTLEPGIAVDLNHAEERCYVPGWMHALPALEVDVDRCLVSQHAPRPIANCIAPGAAVSHEQPQFVIFDLTLQQRALQDVTAATIARGTWYCNGKFWGQALSF